MLVVKQWKLGEQNGLSKAVEVSPVITQNAVAQSWSSNQSWLPPFAKNLQHHSGISSSMTTKWKAKSHHGRVLTFFQAAAPPAVCFFTCQCSGDDAIAVFVLKVPTTMKEDLGEFLSLKIFILKSQVYLRRQLIWRVNVKNQSAIQIMERSQKNGQTLLCDIMSWTSWL